MRRRPGALRVPRRGQSERGRCASADIGASAWAPARCLRATPSSAAAGRAQRRTRRTGGRRRRRRSAAP
eukprot:1114846-Pleurochrysis_carterae.AAC.1